MSDFTEIETFSIYLYSDFSIKSMISLVPGPWCQNQLLDRIFSWHKQCSSMSFYIYCKKTNDYKRVL